MINQLNQWAKALVDAFPSIWWKLYLTPLILGAVAALVFALLPRDSGWLKRCGSALRFLLYLAAAAMVASIGITLVHHYSSPWQAVCNLYDHMLGFFVDAMILVALITSPGVLKNAGVGKDGLPGILLDTRTVWATRFWMAWFYAAAGAMKFLTNETIDFFHASGYSTAFFFFIAAWELGWGLALLWRRTALLALGALSIDMFGAIYTHYHNYFTRGFEGPFENSIDALRMLVLIAYLAFAVSSRKARPDAIKAEKHAAAYT